MIVLPTRFAIGRMLLVQMSPRVADQALKLLIRQFHERGVLLDGRIKALELVCARTIYI